MATVVGTVELEFGATTVTQTVTTPITPSVLTLGAEPTTLWTLGLDIPGLIVSLGPLTGFTWSVAVEPAAIPVPASVWLLATAIGILSMRRYPKRQRPVKLSAGSGVSQGADEVA